MIIKTFTADTAASALKKVRQEMGGDAIVLKTREISDQVGGRQMEVTACLDKPSVAQASAALPNGTQSRLETSVTSPAVVAESPPAARIESGGENDLLDRIGRIESMLGRMFSLGLERTIEGERYAPFKDISRRLREADVPEEFLESLLAAMADGYHEDADCLTLAREHLVGCLSSMMQPDLGFHPGDRVLFTGPAGAGKSSVMGKVAARLVARQKRTVKLVTLDDIKIGAIDEICSYGELLGIEVADASKPEQGAPGDDQAITLIDSPALPRDREKLQALTARIERARPTHRLAVYSALTRSDDIAEFARWIKPLNPTHIAITMTDLTNRQGSVIAAAQCSGLKVGFFTDSPGGLGDVRVPDPDKLARLLLQAEVSLE